MFKSTPIDTIPNLSCEKRKNAGYSLHAIYEVNFVVLYNKVIVFHRKFRTRLLHMFRSI